MGKSFAHKKEIILFKLRWLVVILIHKMVHRGFKRNIFTIGIVTLSCMSIFLVSMYFFIKAHEEFAANFADDILRPLIGNQTTIFFESLFFNVEDHANRISYTLFKTSSLSLTDVTSKKANGGIPHILDITILDKKTPEISASDHPFHLVSLVPLLPDTLPGEGQWTTLVSSDHTPLLAKTYYRPDPQRPFAITTLVKINMHKLHVGLTAGQREPGGPTHPGPGMVPLAIQEKNALLAAFNGGFQRKDGFYGMVVGNATYLPLQRNLATLIIHKFSSPEIINYSGQPLGNDVTAIRQNGPMLIENGKIVTSSEAWNMQTWGLTTTNSMYTWRSGLGITSDGNVVFACGSSLVPETLAKTLQAAHAVNAMQLDINPVWVRFVLFNSIGKGQYTYYSLEKQMLNGGYEYLHGYQKDFFYVYTDTGH